jgi:hypothetical protein
VLLRYPCDAIERVAGAGQDVVPQTGEVLIPARRAVGEAVQLMRAHRADGLHATPIPGSRRRVSIALLGEPAKQAFSMWTSLPGDGAHMLMERNHWRWQQHERLTSQGLLAERDTGHPRYEAFAPGANLSRILRLCRPLFSTLMICTGLD